MQTTKSLACVTDNNNDNLLSHEKNIFSWHTCWGHLGFQHYQWLGRNSIIGNLGINFGSITVNPLPCAAFQIGKQDCTTKGNSRNENHNGGYIKANQIKPVNVIFSDQYESRLKGLYFTAKDHSL